MQDFCYIFAFVFRNVTVILSVFKFMLFYLEMLKLNTFKFILFIEKS